VTSVDVRQEEVELRNSVNIHRLQKIWGKKYIFISKHGANSWYVKIRSDFDRASSLLCGNEMPTRCNRSVASSWHFIST